MRRLSFLFVFLLVVAACGNGDNDTDDVAETTPTPTPTEEVVEEPEPTPTEPAPVEEDEPTPEEEPTPTEAPDVSEEELSELEAFVDQVVENVVELRGLEKLDELDFAIMSREELTQYLEDETEIEQTEIDLYWLFRLISDRDIDLQQAVIDVQAADIYGFYNFEEKETYLIAEDEDLSAMEEVFLAHEIVHALQDQHYDLGQLDGPESDYDRSLAFRAIVEGDAVLTQELYAQRYFDEEKRREYRQEAISAMRDATAMESLESLPPYFLEWFSFPYSAGPMYLLQVFDGTFDPIDAVLADPPVSTQQILNPEAHLNGEIADPVEVELPDLDERLEDGWELYDEGTFGVFDLAIMLEENGVADSDAALEEWAGSATALYENDGHVLGVLSTRWLSEQGAANFEEALIATMTGYDEEDGIWIGDDRYHTIIATGDTVNLKSSTDPDALLDAAAMN